MVAIKLLLVIATVFGSCYGQNDTCDPTLLGHREGKDGFDVCIFESTNTPLTTFVAAAGGTLWHLQNALSLGKCYCKQSCSPPQIVCQNPTLVGPAFTASLIGSGNPPPNALSQFIYNLEDWQMYCFCPSMVDADEACVPVAHPEKCYD